MTLKPCPFCGADAILKDHRTVWTVECTQCTGLVMGQRAKEPDGKEPDRYWEIIKSTAIDRWNQRTVDQRIAELESKYAHCQDILDAVGGPEEVEEKERREKDAERIQFIEDMDIKPKDGQRQMTWGADMTFREAVDAAMREGDG